MADLLLVLLICVINYYMNEIRFIIAYKFYNGIIYFIKIYIM